MNEFVRQLDMKVLGRRLQKVRQHIGMKQSEVAAEIGCAPLTISRMERGETSTSLLPLLVYYSQTVTSICFSGMSSILTMRLSTPRTPVCKHWLRSD